MKIVAIGGTGLIRLMTLFFIIVASCLGAAANASAADIRSISRLAVGPGDILFVADWKTARVHAITLPEAAQKAPGAAFNILDLEALLSKQVGGARITVEDMVARPGTAEVYVALSYGAAKTPALIMVTSDHKAHRIDLKAAKSTSIALRDAPTTDYEFWRETPERSFTVTDMKWRDGELFIDKMALLFDRPEHCGCKCPGECPCCAGLTRSHHELELKHDGDDERRFRCMASVHWPGLYHGVVDDLCIGPLHDRRERERVKVFFPHTVDEVESAYLLCRYSLKDKCCEMRTTPG